MTYKYEPIDKIKAIKAIYEIFERYFGNDKGSGDMYCDFVEDMELFDPEWNEETGGYENDDLPPRVEELMISAGIKPQDIFDALNLNVHCFPDEMCRVYGFDPIKV